MSSVLTGEQNHDSRIMMAFEHNVKMTHFRHDTVTGYKLIFTTHTKYSSMIAAIDICENLQSSVDRPEWLVYIPYGDSFYAAEYVEPNRRNVVSIYAVPCLLCNDVIVPKPESPSGLLLIAKEVVKDFELIVPFWPSVILLFIMLRLALRSEWMERKIYA